MKLSFQNIKIPLIITSILGTIILILTLLMTSPLFQVQLAQEDSHLELGKTAITNPAYYLEGEDWCVALSYVDTSQVRKKQIGRYPITIYHGFQKYTCYVNVLDTLAPELSSDVKQKTIKPGDVLSANALGIKIKDASEIESIGFCNISSNKFYTGLPEDQIQDMIDAYEAGIEIWAEELQFSFGGIYTMTIRVTDAYNNSSDIQIDIIVEEPPVIEAPSDIYLTSNSTPDYSEYVKAWDFLDEDFSSKDVVIDSSQISLGKEGTYALIYSGTDDYGLNSTFTTNVHVYSAANLQKLINTHAINIQDHIIVDAPNPYDAGYFSENNYAYIQSYLEPTIVHIENDSLSTFGSGFIIDIDDAFVTIATNEHVINSDLEVDVTFYDGSCISATVVASNPEDDIAFIRIPITDEGNEASLSSGFISTLRTVHIDYDYWKKLDNDCNITVCYRCIDDSGEVWEQASGTMIEKEATRDWNEYLNLNQTIVSYPAIPGTSGSAIFDGYGHLVGMMRGYTSYPDYTETIVVPLVEILNYYELVFKTRVEYQ